MKLIGHIGRHVVSAAERDLLLIKGYAGTGKTTMVSSLVKTLDEISGKYVLLAPTGRAAKVLSAYSGRTAYTIHKKIYRQKTAREGTAEFVLDRNLHSNTFFIVDEASMISNQSQENNLFGSGRLLEDLISYVYNPRGCKLILIGDTAQLPPVGLNLSPALDTRQLQQLGLNVTEVFLEDIVRQSAESGILYNATLLRKDLSNNQLVKPSFHLDGFTDIEHTNGEFLIEQISSSYDHYGMNGTIIVTRSNKRANRFNAAIRKQILWREDELEKGDLLMIVRNNYYWAGEETGIDFIANGDIAGVNRIFRVEERYGFRFGEVELEFPDYGNIQIRTMILMDTLMSDTASLGTEDGRRLYNNIAEDFPEIKAKRKRYETIREHPYFNALQVKFAYAVTCHKSQGGQWKSVFVDQGYINESMINLEYYRWLYTALTRATRKLHLVNFPADFFS